MSAALHGVAALFFANEYHASDAAYLFALAEQPPYLRQIVQQHRADETGPVRASHIHGS